MRAKELIKKLCDYCGKEFSASRQDVRYCSHGCNSKAYRETKRKEVVALTETLVSKKQIEKAVVTLSDREYLSISEAAALTGVSRWTIYRNVVSGIIPAKRISQRTTLIRKKDIESLFDEVEPYEVLQTGERKPIDEWYTLDEITERYGLLRHRIRKIINAEGITTKKDGTRTLIAKGKIDTYFKKKGFDGSLSNLADWLTISGVVDEYGMTETAVHVFVSRYSIPKKRANGKLYYSKQHIDKLKNKGQ